MKKRRCCVYPGSFDPVTTGHEDIIRRAAALFDEVHVAVLHNPDKQGCFPVEERLALLREVCRGYENVQVDTFSGLTVDFAASVGACALVRGLRSAGDYEDENTLAQINRRLAPDLETVFLTARPEHAAVSSSAVRQLLSFGGSIQGFVPASVEENIRLKFGQYHTD